MSNWQSMETAPRDGTPIQVRSKGYRTEHSLWWNARGGHWMKGRFEFHLATPRAWEWKLPVPIVGSGFSPEELFLQPVCIECRDNICDAGQMWSRHDIWKGQECGNVDCDEKLPPAIRYIKHMTMEEEFASISDQEVIIPGGVTAFGHETEKGFK